MKFLSISHKIFAKHKNVYVFHYHHVRSSLALSLNHSMTNRLMLSIISTLDRSIYCWGYLLRAVRRLTLRWKLQILSYFYSFQSFQSIFGLYMMKQYVVKLRNLCSILYWFLCFWCHTMIMEDFSKSHKKGIQYQRKPLFVSWSSTLITKNHDFYQLDIHLVLYGSFCFLYRFH